MFHCILSNNFQKFQKFVVLGRGNSFEKFQNFFESFLIFFQNRKTVIIVSKSVQNNHIDPNFFRKLTKNCQFSLKTIYFFEIFGAFGGKNLEF